MHFTKPFGVLAGAIMIALALAAPVINGPADAVAIPAARETLQAMAKLPDKHVTKAAKPHTTKAPKPHTTKPAKAPITKPAKAPITKPAKAPIAKPAKQHTTTPKQRSTTPAKAPATKTSKTKPAKSTKPAKPTTAKSRPPKPTKPAKPHPTKSVKPKPTKRPASKSARPPVTKLPKRPAPTKLPSNSTSAAPPKPSSPASCALPPKTTKKPSVHRRVYDAALRLFQRDEKVFIGWHGTNDKTATLWETTGHIVKPPSSAAGSSGADAEFGNGLYVADWAYTATYYANGNKNKNNHDAEKAGKPKDYQARVCAIYAKSKSNWLNKTPKILLKLDLKGNEPSKEKARLAYIKKSIVGPSTIDPATVQRFAPLKLPTDGPDASDAGVLKGQLILVNGQDYEAQCFEPAEDGSPPAGAQNVRNYPEFAYMSYALQQEWRITGILDLCAS